MPKKKAKTGKTKRPSTRNIPAKRTPAVRITVAARGLVDWITARDGVEIRVYSSYGEAIAGGIAAGRAAAVFGTEKGAGCSAGECVKFSEMRRGKKFSWCNSQGENPCETPSNNCECHLIRSWEDPANPGTWKTEDLGRVTKKKAEKEDGTSTYYCSCVSG